MASLQSPVQRLAGTAKGRSAGSAVGGMVWVAAVPDKTDPDIAQQSTDIFAKLDRMLEGLGTCKTRIISGTCYLSSLANKPAFDQAWVKWIGEDTTNWPQRTCVGADLVNGALVEIMLLAVSE